MKFIKYQSHFPKRITRTLKIIILLLFIRDLDINYEMAMNNIADRSRLPNLNDINIDLDEIDGYHRELLVDWAIQRCKTQ